MYKKLSEIKSGKTATIRAFENDELFIKLMEMGCLPGEKITVEQIAPLKDPISVSVAGYILSLRLEEAESIIVEEVI
jgi:ferrous iron transport protein A